MRRITGFDGGCSLKILLYSHWIQENGFGVPYFDNLITETHQFLNQALINTS